VARVVPGCARPVKGFTRSDPSKPGEAIMAVPLNHARRLRDTGLAMPEKSTTPDLVELLRRAFEAGNRGDLDALMGFYTADVVLEAAGTGLSFEGRAAVRRFYEDWFSVYKDFESELEEALDLGNGVGFSVLRSRGRPVGSTASAEQCSAWVSTWVEDVIPLVTVYTDIDEARAAAERLAESRE
jgi:ketosteroid isomerase-like protein